MTEGKKMFDAEKHRFGMAYYDEADPDRPIIYPEKPYNGLVHWMADTWRKVHYSLDMAEKRLIRAPEHDLIPKAKADKLAKILRKVLKDVSGDRGIIDVESFNKLDKALAEYEGENE
jgi:hypothetical protein